MRPGLAGCLFLGGAAGEIEHAPFEAYGRPRSEEIVFFGLVGPSSIRKTCTRGDGDSQITSLALDLLCVYIVSTRVLGG